MMGKPKISTDKKHPFAVPPLKKTAKRMTKKQKGKARMVSKKLKGMKGS